MGSLFIAGSKLSYLILNKLISPLLAAFAFVLFTLAGNSYGQQVQVDIYAMQDSPPYSYLHEENLTGIYTDVIKSAFAKMKGYDINVLPVPFRRGLSFMESGTGFGIYPPYYRPDTRPYIHPYSVPILREQITVYCHEKVFNQNQRVQWPEDYFKLRIGTNSGYTIGGDAFWEAVKTGKIRIQQSESHLRSVMLLAKGRVDCYLTDKASFKWALKQVKMNNGIAENNPAYRFVQGPVISQEQGYLGFSAFDDKFGFKQDFVEQFNHAIEDLRASGEIDSIVKRYTD